MWQMESYQSGTVIVTSHEPNTPHFYVYGYDETHRMNIAVDLEIFLNHARQLPEWVYGLYRHPDEPTTAMNGVIQWANQNNKRIKWKEPIIH